MQTSTTDTICNGGSWCKPQVQIPFVMEVYGANRRYRSFVMEVLVDAKISTQEPESHVHQAQTVDLQTKACQSV